MEKIEVTSFKKSKNVRRFPKGKLELVEIGGAILGLATFQPGWKWSTHVRPLAETTSCLAPHFQYHLSGVMKIVMDDGTTKVCKPGDVSYVPSGHDAWVVGKEPAVVVDFQGMVDYAKKSRK